MSRDSRLHRQALAMILLLSGSIHATQIASAQCTDCDSDGFTYPTDCNDAATEIYPGQIEVCNGFDDDCDGDIDEAAGCLRDCPFPDAQAPPLPLLDNGIFGALQGIAWSGTTLGLLNDVPDTGVERRVQLSRYTGDGVLLGHTDVGLRGSSGEPSVAWTGEAFAVVWVEHDAGPVGNQAFLARVGAGGQLLGSPVVWRACGTGLSADRCEFPLLVWSGERFGVVWLDSVDGLLQFIALDGDGQPLPGTLITLTNDISSASTRPPFGIAANAGVFSIVWKSAGVVIEQTSSFFRRLSPDGVPLGITTILPDGCVPRLTAAGSGWGVAQTIPATGTSCSSANRVQLTLLDSAGLVTSGPDMAGPPPLAPDGGVAGTVVSAGAANKLSVAWTGAEYGLIWAGFDRGAWPETGIAMISRFAASGSFIATRRVTLDRDSDIAFPRAVWTGGKYVVAWRQNSSFHHQIGTYRCDCSVDDDGDDSSTCSDCDDGDAAVSSYGAEVCDGVNNNCYHGTFPAPGPDTIDYDDDGDAFTDCDGDCMEFGSRADTVYPSAPQICADGLNNDCDHPAWPSLDGTNEGDVDGDLFTGCEGDCDDTVGAVRPFGPSVCDGLNNDCNDPLWPGLGTTEEVAGGWCEVSGGQIPTIDLELTVDGMLHWQVDATFPAWNVYRGDLAALVCDPQEICNWFEEGDVCRQVCRPGGGWMQPPGGNALAAQTCNTQETSLMDVVALQPGQVAIYLVTGVASAGPDGALGAWKENVLLTGAEGVRVQEAACP